MTSPPSSVAAVTSPERTWLGVPRSSAIAFLAIFAAAFVLYAVGWRTAPVLEGDSAQYLEAARDLADFHLDAVHNRTPGYPLLLVLTGSSQAPTRTLFFVSLLLHFASIWMLAAVLARAALGRPALFTFAVILLLPLFVEPAAYVLTENLAQALLVAGLASLCLAMSRPRDMALLFVSSAAFAGAALVRPAYEALAAAMALLLLAAALVRIGSGAQWPRQALRMALVLMLGSSLVLGAFSFVNQRRFGYWGVSPLVGFHLSTKTMRFVERAPDEYAVEREILVRARDAELTERGGTHTGTQAVWRAQAELTAATGLSTPRLSARLLRMNVALIRSAPLMYLEDVTRAAATYWLPATTDVAAMHSTILRWTWVLLWGVTAVVFWLQLAAWVGAGAFLASPGRTAALPMLQRASAFQVMSYALAGAIVFYTMAVSCLVDIGDPRQRRATDVLIVFMCFLGAHLWRRGVGGRA